MPRQRFSNSRTGTGFVFGDFSADALLDTIRFALQCWKDREGWKVLQQNGMQRDFSWDRQSDEYIELYQKLVPPAARHGFESAPGEAQPLAAPSVHAPQHAAKHAAPRKVSRRK